MTGGGTSKARSGWTLLFAGCLLVLQTWFVLHQIEHLLHHDDEPCEVCLLANGANAPLPAATPTPMPRLPASPDARPTAASEPISSAYRPQSPRAPPGPLLT